MAKKHIFIGLGGSGCETVAAVKFKVYQRMANTDDRVSRMDDKYRFLFVDTDEGELDRQNRKYRDVYETGRKKMISTEELVNLGQQNPAAIYRQAKNAPNEQMNQRITEACSENVAFRMDDRALQFGAGAFRLKSRTAFARMAGEFCDKLRADIRSLSTIESNASQRDQICYWVVCSCAGGTGSGIVNDVLYYVNMIHKSSIDPGDPKVCLVLYMPQCFIDHNSHNERYPNNAFAVMNELESIQCWSKDPQHSHLFHRLALLDGYSTIDTQYPYRPFECCIPVDYQTETGNNMGSLSKMYSNTAEMLFYVHEGEGATGFESFMDNNRDGAQLGHEDKCFLLPMGYVALKKPVAEFDEYWKLRIQYEMLQYGIVGSEPKEEVATEASKTTFDAIIRRLIFDRDKHTSLLGHFLSRAHELREREYSEDYFMDGDKFKTRLPDTSIDDAKRITDKLPRLFAQDENFTAQIKEALRTELWDRAEEYIERYGLRYAGTTFRHLDDMCEKLCQTYHKKGKEFYDVYQTLVAGKTPRPQEEDLATLREDAEHTSLGEALGNLMQRIGIANQMSNSNQVKEYYMRSSQMIRSMMEDKVYDMCFEMLSALCHGDDGILDDILLHIRRLNKTAEEMLNNPEGPRYRYREGLAQKFRSAKDDVTSVYLPNICTFVDDNGWEKENPFSNIYCDVVHRTTELIPQEGYRPVREGSDSLQHILDNIFLNLGKQLEQNNYISIVKQDEQTITRRQLFINRNIGAQKNIEDVLTMSEQVFNQLMTKKDSYTRWNDSGLAEMYDNLPQTERDTIVKQLKPSLFFSYNINQMESTLEQREFCVAQTENMAKNIFGFAGRPNQRFIPSADKSLMYIIAVKLGMSFNYYRTYDFIRNKYKACQDKEFYHFHKQFALSGGEAEKLQLPRTEDPSLTTLLRLMLLDKMQHSFVDYMYKPSEYEKDRYAFSPLTQEAHSIRIATLSSIEDHDGQPAIRIDKGYTVPIDNARSQYVTIARAFKEHFADSHIEDFFRKFISMLNQHKHDLLLAHFEESRQQLCSTLQQRLTEDISLDERKLVEELLDSITHRMTRYNDFINQ
ncbi:MAG: hypothetical protein IJV22_07105 [Bacteroidales bacterium]|nr:hypothetical protein [Bacteroidales bacterium]